MGGIGQNNPEYFKDKDILIFDHHLGKAEYGVSIKDVGAWCRNDYWSK